MYIINRYIHVVRTFNVLPNCLQPRKWFLGRLKVIQSLFSYNSRVRICLHALRLICRNQFHRSLAENLIKAGTKSRL